MLVQQERLSANEPARLVEIHKAAQAYLQRRIQVVDVVPIIAIRLFQTQRFQRLQPGKHQPDVLARLHEHIKDVERKLGGDVRRDIVQPPKMKDVIYSENR